MACDADGRGEHEAAVAQHPREAAATHALVRIKGERACGCKGAGVLVVCVCVCVWCVWCVWGGIGFRLGSEFQS